MRRMVLLALERAGTGTDPEAVGQAKSATVDPIPVKIGKFAQPRTRVDQQANDCDLARHLFFSLSQSEAKLPILCR